MTVVLVITVAAVLWLLSLYLKPFGRCGRCQGRGVLVDGAGASACPRCKGLKRQQRPGSRTVHRTVRMIRAEIERTRKDTRP